MRARQPNDRTAAASAQAQLLYKIEFLCAATKQSCGARDLPPSMASSTASEVFIQGITRDGRTFRPSDWAERLAGVMSSFRPGGAQPGSHLNYSPWCIPTMIEGVKCVIVNRELRDYEPMAWDFVINFAKDNNLKVSEGKFEKQHAPETKN